MHIYNKVVCNKTGRQRHISYSNVYNMVLYYSIVCRTLVNITTPETTTTPKLPGARKRRRTTKEGTRSSLRFKLLISSVVRAPFCCIQYHSMTCAMYTSNLHHSLCSPLAIPLSLSRPLTMMLTAVHPQSGDQTQTTARNHRCCCCCFRRRHSMAARRHTWTGDCQQQRCWRHHRAARHDRMH